MSNFSLVHFRCNPSICGFVVSEDGGTDPAAHLQTAWREILGLSHGGVQPFSGEVPAQETGLFLKRVLRRFCLMSLAKIDNKKSQ